MVTFARQYFGSIGIKSGLLLYLIKLTLLSMKDLRAIFCGAIIMAFSCFLPGTSEAQTLSSDPRFELFKNPPAEAKPFVRWWWNGNRVNEKEVLRELDLLKQAGFGGVEINPIAMPPHSKEPMQEPLEWLSPEWNKVLKAACVGAKERGMIADLLVGSGWPFGGKFLRPDQTIERMAVNYKDIKGSKKISLNVSDLEDDLPKEYLGGQLEKESERILTFVRLFPQNLNSTHQIIDLMPFVKDNSIVYQIPEGEYRLAWGVLQKGYREVVHGTLGADGPTMNHLDEEVTLAFLNRLKEIERDLGIPLAELVRALFCDSMELAGSNWCNDFASEFMKRMGYSLDPFYPFIFHYFSEPYPYEINSAAFADTLLRVRYDYNRVLVDLFQERFTSVFKQFCMENDLLCRFQAYGSPWLIGILDGYLQADIPESNNWFYVQNSKPEAEDYFTWVKQHGSMIWNKYASTAAHLTNRDIVSCEAMTNLGGVFKASLSTIKQADDMNFISGITHSVLHGYNYSPPEAGFPGWIRYGTFFSEHNTLWPHFSKWLRYTSRISAVLQNSDPDIDIAILGPEADTWSKDGLRRVPFHMEPSYVYDLWQAISQNGSSCDYINERVIQDANMKKGLIKYGPMAYKTLILADTKSMSTKTLRAIEQFVKKGGKVIFIGQEPVRSSSLSKPDQDEVILSFMQKIKKYDNQLVFIDAPLSGINITEWVGSLFNKAKIRPDLNIGSPDQSLYQIHHKYGDSDIFFITNTNRKRKIINQADFELEGKSVWKWNPEKGTRELLSYENNTIYFSLNPLESMLLFIEPGQGNTNAKRYAHIPKELEEMKIQAGWIAKFVPIEGEPFSRTFTELIDFKESSDTLLQNFAGRVVYSTSFDASESNFASLNLGIVNDGVTKVVLNGMSLGQRWYGKHIYELDSQMRLGPNTLEIEYTSLLWNYCRSLDMPETNRWIRNRDLISNGLLGPVVFD